MRLAALLLPLFLLAPSPGAGAPKPVSADLPRIMVSGRYRCVVTGLLCEACRRAVTLEILKIKPVQECRFDEDSAILWITVAPGKKLRLSQLTRALRFATERVNLDTEFSLTDIRFEP
jgi:hypothetical protein